MKKSFGTLAIVACAMCLMISGATVAEAQANMITNGGFENGNTGFTSDYPYDTRNPMAIGRYVIGTNSDNSNTTYFVNLPDHTTGSGNYFISDASGDITLSPWISEQSIAITSTTSTYRFRAYLANINDDPGARDEPALAFEIGDGTTWVEIASTDTVALGANASNVGWVLFEQSMKFNGTGTFYVRLRNDATGTIGNDFGLDDVSFEECGSCTASQTVNLGSLSGADTAPTLTSSSPSDDATSVGVADNIVLTFNENIAAGTGNIVISDGASDTRTIPVGDAQVSISGATLTINPTADLAYSTAYNVQIDATAFDDAAGNSYAGIADATTLNFTTAAPATNITFTDTSQHAYVDWLNVDSFIGAQGISGTITKQSDLAFTPNVGQVSGINYPGSWYSPTPSSNAEFYNDALLPNDTGTTYTISFSEPVVNPRLHFLNFDEARITFDGSLSIGRMSGNPELEVAGNVVNGIGVARNAGCEADNGSNPNGACGTVAVIGTVSTVTFTLTHNGTTGDGYSFTVSLPDEAPTLVSSSPADNATDVAVDTDIVLTFDEPVVEGIGYIHLYNADGFVKSFQAGTAAVQFSENTVTLVSDSPLNAGTEYWVVVDSDTEILDNTGNGSEVFGSASAANSQPVSFTTTASTFTHVDMCGYVNANPSIPASYPVGSEITGNSRTNIPFTTCAFGGGGMGTLVMQGTDTLPSNAPQSIEIDVPNVSGQKTVYALLNNYFGTTDANEYTFAVNFTDSTSVSFDAIGGQDTRDFNQNVSTSNSVGNDTTTWWSNYTAGSSVYQRLDVRQFDISAYSSKTIESVTLTQVHPKDSAMLSGLTFTLNPMGILPNLDPDSNSAPVVFAGDNQSVVSGSVVSLSGAAEDSDGDTLTYTWRQIDGSGDTISTTALSATDILNPTFTAPTVAYDAEPQTLRFELSVGDGTETITKVVTIIVSPKEILTNWADWQAETTFPYANLIDSRYKYRDGGSGTVLDPNTGQQVGFTMSGEVNGVSQYSNNNSINWYNPENPSSAYEGSFIKSPNGSDLIVQTGYTAPQYQSHEIVFDQEVTGLVMGIWSLGGAEASSIMFERSFTIVDTDTLTQSETTSGYVLNGDGAAGIIQFCGPIKSLKWNVSKPEFYSAFNFAITTLPITCPDGPSKTIPGFDTAGPVITGPSGAPEDTASTVEVAEGVMSVTQMSATDEHEFTWSIGDPSEEGYDNELFEIDTDGNLSFKGAPDFEDERGIVYVVQVKATDAFANVSVHNVTVTVTDVWDSLPGTIPSYSDDKDGDGIADSLESTTADRDGDGIADASDYDPQGYFYCEDDGRILAGGSITVTGPNGSNSSVGTANNIRIVKDGSDGEYQWFATAPGTYTMAVTRPTSVGVPSTARTSSGTLDVTTLLPSNPASIGSSEFENEGLLANYRTGYSLSSPPANTTTTYYEEFVIEAGDPHVLGNNIPVAQCGENNVTVEGSTNGAEANGDSTTSAVFTIDQGRVSTLDTVVRYSVSGTATSGTDFTALSGSATIPAGDTSITVPVSILEDTLIEGDETIVVTLTGITSGDLTTQLSATASQLTASQVITDDDFATVIVSNDDLITTEGRSDDNATMSFSLGGQPTSDVVLNFTGDAQCTVSPPTMTFTAGDFATQQALSISAINDEDVEGAHSCQPTVAVASTDLRFDSFALALSTVTVADDLVDQVRDPLKNILQSNFEQTVTTQSRQFSQISKGALGRLQSDEEERCGVVEALDTDGKAQASAEGFNTSGVFGEESYDCETGVRHILDGSFAVNSSDAVDTQGIISFTIQNENQTADEVLSGKFFGGYLSSSSLAGVATGNLQGVGVHAGLYGARKFQSGLFIDYYAAGGLGRHKYDASFYAQSAPITAEGDYSYQAVYTGAALSGETVYERMTLRPRAGIDLTYADASDASVSASQMGITDLGRIKLDAINGSRIFAETLWVFGEQGPVDEDVAGELSLKRSLEVAPRVYCEQGIGRDERNCGYGGYISFNETNLSKSSDIAVTLDYENTNSGSERFGIDLSYSRDILDGAGKLATQVGSDASRNATVSQTLSIEF